MEEDDDWLNHGRENGAATNRDYDVNVGAGTGVGVTREGMKDNVVEDIVVEDNVVEEKNSEMEDLCVPIKMSLDMVFDTPEELFEYFRGYACQKGFPVKKRSSRADKEGNIVYVRLCCTREGWRPSRSINSAKPRPVCGVKCNVHVSGKLEPDGKWHIISLYLDHSHDCDPSMVRLFRCNRKMNNRAKDELAMRDEAGMRPMQNYRVSVVESGGYNKVSYISKDARNHIDKVRRLRLGDVDATAVQKYFAQMKEQNKDFFYIMDVDKFGQLENLFWADARSRLAYKEFGDVITFDTTYLVNRYDMPFAPFVGVNHHGQSILLGCGLVSHETTYTFTWLFSKWLECMDGVAPQGIITDQDRAMQGAIVNVFPYTKHRWCVWHIMKKCNEKLGGYDDHIAITRDMHDCVYDSQWPLDFEKSWLQMIEKYELQNNPWLSGLYEERHRWVPTYVKDSFWAGMSTTQRSEGINAFFDGYVNPKTSLKSFVEQYDNALRSKIEKETQEDCRSHSKNIPLTSCIPIEKQIQEKYTIIKFKEFQDQLNAQTFLRLISTRIDGQSTVYEILELRGWGYGSKDVTYTVLFNSTSKEFQCSCHLFEYRGTICKHAIYVLVTERVEFVPEKYILRRWRKDLKRPHSRVTITDNGWVISAEYKRYKDMCTYFSDVADTASGSVEDTLELLELLRCFKIKTANSKSKCGSSNPAPHVPHKIIDEVEVPTASTEILNPIKVRRKGQYKRFVGQGMKESDKAKKKHKAIAKQLQGKGLKEAPTLRDEGEVQPTRIFGFYTPQLEKGNGDQPWDNDDVSINIPNDSEDAFRQRLYCEDDLSWLYTPLEK